MTATLMLEGVEKVYPNGFHAVKGVDLDIAEGELIVLVGPSGCGKSTLLRMIAGLETVTRGDIRIGGESVRDREPAERDIAMVFQNYALYPHMSVFDNMAYGLRNRRTPKDEIRARVEETARILELSHLLDRKPRQLSGGQRQRVAMGRAIARRPRAFLFDEPLSNLDAKLRVQMRVEIRTLQQRLGATSVYVTHDQLEAMTLADRLVIMDAGEVQQVGRPMEVYRRPETAFVAAFIGSPGMNLFPADRLPGLPAGARAGVRPEDLSLVPVAGPSLSGRVAAVERVGFEAFLHLAVPGIETPLVVRAAGDTPLQPGDAATVTAPEAALHLFDAASGRRLRDPVPA